MLPPPPTACAWAGCGALGEGLADAPPDAVANELFRAGSDGNIDAALDQLDRVVESAGHHGLRLVIVLCNHWGDYGGVPMYLRWAGLADRDDFYTAPSVRAAYRAHVTRVLSRRNSRTGVRYVDDPTVMAWELINESQAETPAGETARLQWLDEMGGLVHRLAPRQLVSAGVWGYGTRAERRAWQAACAVQQIDYCDSHLYPETTDEVDSVERMLALVDDRAQLAHFVVDKPLVLGEVGFDTRAAAPLRLGLSRAEWLGRLLDRAALDAVDGVMVWIYQPWNGRERDFGIYVDRPDTDDVRAVLREPRVTGNNPALGPRRGDAPLYDVYRTMRQESPVSDENGTFFLDPTRPHDGRWERLGRYEPPSGRPHAYGSPDGEFGWRVRLPAGRFELGVRLSSEFPGTHAPPDGGSRVTVRLDGRVIGHLDAIPDDGVGRLESLAMHVKAGRHRLALVVEPGPTCARAVRVWARADGAQAFRSR